MKHIVYRIAEPASSGAPYNVTQVFDEETFEVFEERLFEANSAKAIIPKPHFVIRDANGNQINMIMGDFIEAHDDPRPARIQAGRLNEVNQVMEA